MKHPWSTSLETPSKPTVTNVSIPETLRKNESSAISNIKVQVNAQMAQPFKILRKSKSRGRLKLPQASIDNGLNRNQRAHDDDIKFDRQGLFRLDEPDEGNIESA
jgi:hypothetical protein